MRILLLIGLLLFQQPQFEVASIKPNKSGTTFSAGVCHGSDKPQSPRTVLPTPLGRCVFKNSTLHFLIAAAYESNNNWDGMDRGIRGGPGWIRTANFDVDAKADSATAKHAELLDMLKNLLADRFKLKLHQETREVQGYELHVAGTGLLMKPNADGRKGYGSRGAGEILANIGASAADLAGLLSNQLGAPVVDKTGLNGVYPFTLTFANPRAPIEASAGPDIFTAVQKQLGLRLVAQKLPVQMYVVDSAELPQ